MDSLNNYKEYKANRQQTTDPIILMLKSTDYILILKYIFLTKINHIHSFKLIDYIHKLQVR